MRRPRSERRREAEERAARPRDVVALLRAGKLGEKEAAKVRKRLKLADR